MLFFNILSVVCTQTCSPSLWLNYYPFIFFPLSSLSHFPLDYHGFGTGGEPIHVNLIRHIMQKFPIDSFFLLNFPIPSIFGSLS